MEYAITNEPRHKRNEEGFISFNILHKFIKTTNQTVIFGHEYQFKCGLQVSRLRLNNITFQNDIMRMNLFLIDEEKCYSIYQSLDHSEDSTWALYDKGTFDLQEYGEFKRNDRKELLFRAMSDNELLEFEF